MNTFFRVNTNESNRTMGYFPMKETLKKGMINYKP